MCFCGAKSRVRALVSTSALDKFALILLIVAWTFGAEHPARIKRAGLWSGLVLCNEGGS